MDSRRRTPADLDVADLDKALLLISPEAAQEIRGFRNSLKNLQLRQRIEHCQRKRDDLLSCYKGLEAVFVCYWLVFQTCSIKKQGEAWDKFDEVVVRSREASKCLKSLIGVSDVWGKEVIIHYGFLSRYRTYCDELHAIAREVPTWDEAVAIFNQSIDQRIRKNDGRTRMKESSNPIERRDLAYVKAYVKTAKHRRPAFPGLLPGYGRDKYGLIVRAKFAEESRALSPLPSSSSQQLLDPKPTLGSDGYDGSTLVPSPLLPSSQQCSPSPSKAASVESNGPSPPSSPPLETSPSRPLLTSAWLSAVPLSLLDEGKWIDDRIVNAYMHVLAVKHPGTCFLNSHFLGQYGSKMKKWRPESGKHPLSSDFVLMPVNDKHHWSLLVMYKRFLTGTGTNEWVVCFLDSLGSSHEETFVCWENYLEACGNKLMVRKIDVKVPRQTNCTDCGVYVLGFAKEFLKKPWGFTDAVDRGKHLDWKISAPSLRKDIRAILAAVSDATTDNDKATGGDGCGDFGVCHGGAEITESLGDDVVNSDDEYCWECGNKGSEDDVDRKAW
ncbi:hypothetical protein F4824DRAFT_35375 [Ustulina deusta]|nr:hypothetical protein F4824DRAFT_35375 [Ustulina deusta]